MLWTEKYKPSFDEICGQEEAKLKLEDFIINFNKQAKNAVMLYGPSGTGKNLMVYSLASKLNYELIELNASDFRDREQLQKIIFSSLRQKSLFSKGKIILIDELEGLNSEDKGAIPEIIKLLENKTYPIVFITNDAWQEKIRKIRVKSSLVKFKPLEKEHIIYILNRILQKEKLKIPEKILEIIASRSQGDARAAINDLQTVAICRDAQKEYLECPGFREKEDTIFQALNLIFKSTSALNAFDNVNMDINELMLWLDENIPIEYSGSDITKAYEALSMADVFRGRIMRRQHWRFLVYVNNFITQGIALAKTETKKDFTSYKPPTRILKLWIAKQKLAKKRSISEKLASKIHCSKRQAQQDFFLIEKTIRKNIPKDIKLDEEELAFLRNAA